MFGFFWLFGYELLAFLYSVFFFFFNDTATTEIYTLSLHDALPISLGRVHLTPCCRSCLYDGPVRSEEHTSELQSRRDLVCRLLLEKKKKNYFQQLTKKKKQKASKKKRTKQL